jgi:hypothetical protein
MPTAAKLFAAIAFTLVGFFAAQVTMPHMPQGTQFGAFVPLSALIGLVCGWRIMGPAAGRGNFAAVSVGIRTSAAMLALALVLFSIEGMLVIAFRRSYDGPMDAILGVVEVAINYLSTIMVPDVVGVLLVGGALSGLLCEWADRRWA